MYYFSHNNWKTFNGFMCASESFQIIWSIRGCSAVAQVLFCSLEIFALTNARRLAHLVVHVRSIKEMGWRLHGRAPTSVQSLHAQRTIECSSWTECFLRFPSRHIWFGLVTPRSSSFMRWVAKEVSLIRYTQCFVFLSG